MREKSPPPDLNRDYRSYKERALPVELGGQGIVLSPAYVFTLHIARWLNPKIHPGRWNLLGWNHINPVVVGQYTANKSTSPK